MTSTLDGSELLTGPQAGGVLEAAVTNAGGELETWSLDHVDHRPSRSTKALFRTSVRWPQLDGPHGDARDELFGMSAHIGEQEKNVLNAEQSLVMTDGDMNVRVWRYPHDPWLPALPHVCYPDVLHATLLELGVDTGYAPGTPLAVEVVSYRPGRRAVLKAALADRNVYLKVFQPHLTDEIVDLHLTLLDAGVPVPEVPAHSEGLMVLEELPGTVLSQAVVEEGAASCRGSELVDMLDRLPSSLMDQPSRPAWTESASFYAGVVGSSLPALRERLDVLVRRIETGLDEVERRIGLEPTDVVHGDFYEAQVFVDAGHVVGLLDIDGVGPGRRADDLACMFAHLSVLGDYANQQRIPLDVHRRVAGAIRAWYPIFSERVDPQELALRAAGVVLSLATGPHRQQENNWAEATEAMVRVAETWVQVAEYGPEYVGPMPGGLIEEGAPKVRTYASAPADEEHGRRAANRESAQVADGTETLAGASASGATAAEGSSSASADDDFPHTPGTGTGGASPNGADSADRADSSNSADSADSADTGRDEESSAYIAYIPDSVPTAVLVPSANVAEEEADADEIKPVPPRTRGKRARGAATFDQDPTVPIPIIPLEPLEGAPGETRGAALADSPEHTAEQPSASRRPGLFSPPTPVTVGRRRHRRITPAPIILPRPRDGSSAAAADTRSVVESAGDPTPPSDPTPERADHDGDAKKDAPHHDT